MFGRLLVVPLLIACAAPPVAAVAAPPAPRSVESVEQVMARIEREHPAAYYELAKRLFEQGRRDDAVFWFYVGQIRYRSRLMHNPNLPKDGEPALFASLSQVVGAPLNRYAFGDIPKLAETIDRALAWDAEQPDPLSPKDAVRDEVRNGLVKMKADMLARAGEIRANRVRNGLENADQR